MYLLKIAVNRGLKRVFSMRDKALYVFAKNRDKLRLKPGSSLYAQ
jgi:hypothetical protein